MKRIGILETGHNSQVLAERFGRFSDNFSAWLDAHREEFPFELAVWQVENHEFPAHPRECDGYIITGSAAGVYEDHDWLEPTRAFIREAVEQQVKLLGVCFGHQLLADTLGGRAEKSHKGWGVGRHTYRVHGSRPWMDPPMPEFSLLACHQDQVTALPPGAEVLASSEFCEFAMFALGEHVMAVQPHPEFSPAYAGALYETRRERFGADVVEQGLASVHEDNHAHEFGRWALGFLTR